MKKKTPKIPISMKELMRNKKKNILKKWVNERITKEKRKNKSRLKKKKNMSEAGSGESSKSIA